MYHFLVNPSSCSGRGGRYWERVKKELDERSVPYQAHFSEKAGDMARMASELTQTGAGDRDEVHLVVLGGDGTVNETLQGIRDFDRTRFSYIPTGSSNDLARDVGISRDPVKALCQLLDDEKERPMDVGVLHYHTAYAPQGKGLEKVSRPDRLFVVSCGIGFDAGVCQQAMSSRFKDVLNRLGLGKLTYLGIALKMLITSGRAQAVLTAENDAGERTGPVSIRKLMFAACMSHCYEGGGFRFCPGADAADGILDVCAVGNVPKWKVILVLPTAFWGGHYRYRGVEHYEGSRIRIRASRPLWVHTDGEVTALSDDITVSCLRRRLRFYY
ncbi:MAG TPA: diacylglycerol kinase family lipid kinase [Candidatus Eisenbergiella merdipullorum]|uniref:Diacylglycerol kinase family lipid kinase n=1 Tax=Candidatus Eisenbergiella merdipullorum TaxID=2838553 RepID=A0A9D2I5V1_9FIRM|nr:diacylglycerol kinase family lipid kinase [Candidatus Eisenbergiella merdipullorum]